MPHGVHVADNAEDQRRSLTVRTMTCSVHVDQADELWLGRAVAKLMRREVWKDQFLRRLVACRTYGLAITRSRTYVRAPNRAMISEHAETTDPICRHHAVCARAG